MVRVRFWNIGGKPLAEPLRHLCDSHDPDILVLAENKIPTVDLLQTLNRGSQRVFVSPFNLSSRIAFLSRFHGRLFGSVSDDDYCSIRAITPPLGDEILLVAVHYPSKLHSTGEDQSLLMHRIVERIRDAEIRFGHTRTVLVGDLNMNPFESGVCSAEGLHGVMSKQIARMIGRTVYGQERLFFYNPMWNFLGDETRGPPGTYYYAKGVTAYFWNIFDQVLYRPALLDNYQENDVNILTEIGPNSLLRKDRIAGDFSDHLPLFFTVRT